MAKSQLRSNKEKKKPKKEKPKASAATGMAKAMDTASKAKK
jgi:hypothetical protein